MLRHSASVLILLVIVFCTKTLSGVAQPAAEIVKWVVEKNSTLTVAGKSNVNTFTCIISQYDFNDTIYCYSNSNKPIRLTGNLRMNVLSFDCHSNLITKDLQKTLKADDYPRMTIRFISLQAMPLFAAKTEFIKGWLEVELAGVTKRFELNYSFTKNEAKCIRLTGARSFTFSDFNLSPPQKFAGLIKIKDDFDVNFQLVIRAV